MPNQTDDAGKIVHLVSSDQSRSIGSVPSLRPSSGGVMENPSEQKTVDLVESQKEATGALKTLWDSLTAPVDALLEPVTNLLGVGSNTGPVRKESGDLVPSQGGIDYTNGVGYAPSVNPSGQDTYEVSQTGALAPDERSSFVRDYVEKHGHDKPSVSGPEVRDYLSLTGNETGTTYHARKAREIQTRDHFESARAENSQTTTLRDADTLFRNSEHFTLDLNDPDASKRTGDSVRMRKDGTVYRVFSGSTTDINPTNDLEKQYIIDRGLGSVEDVRVPIESFGKYTKPPISPFHPFTRLDPYTAHTAILSSYNRTKIPVADAEFRKGFRYIFISRPECYIMSYGERGGKLSEQAEHDMEFASFYSQKPYILRMLSPRYVTGSFTNDGLNSNWNMLLSNRVLGLSTGTTELEVDEGNGKSIDGYSVHTPLTLTSNTGGTIQLSFQDTKSLDVSDMLRMWMLYMHKRHKGIFAPPYNNYQYHNDFFEALSEGGQKMTGAAYTQLHPYDRAIEFACSIFDIVTNETGSKILYMCKYTGCYPKTMSQEGLSNSNNEALTKAGVSAEFVYMGKQELGNTRFVEFNYNSGITDHLGRPVTTVKDSLSFLLRDNPTDPILPQYVGAGGMFTGSPYIVIGKSQQDPLNPSDALYYPYLRFAPISTMKLDRDINLGITNDMIRNGQSVVGITGEATINAADMAPSDGRIDFIPIETQTTTDSSKGDSSLLGDIVHGVGGLLEGMGKAADGLIHLTPAGAAIDIGKSAAEKAIDIGKGVVDHVVGNFVDNAKGIVNSVGNAIDAVTITPGEIKDFFKN